jgi:hypothetical protein
MFSTDRRDFLDSSVATVGGMRVRWIGLALALAVLGAAGGYALGHLTSDEPTTYASAAPVPAPDPSIPIDPEQPYAPDIDYPPLQTGLDYKTHTIGTRDYRWEYDVPKGWTPERLPFAEVRWRPADEPTVGGYSLRVKIVNAHLTPEQMVDQKLAAVDRIYEGGVVVLARTDDMLSFVYRDELDHKRYNTFRWFTEPGGTEAVFEMSVVGREVDQDGLDDLLDHVSESVHKV